MDTTITHTITKTRTDGRTLEIGLTPDGIMGHVLRAQAQIIKGRLTSYAVTLGYTPPPAPSRFNFSPATRSW